MHSVHIRIASADINECELDIHTCDSNANCTDTEGSFNCTCREGFEGNGFNCTGTRHISHKHHSFACVLYMYAYAINKKSIQTPVVHICLVTIYIFFYVDISECERGLDDCNQNANCINMLGSYSCICRTGFTGDGFTCAG